MSRRPTVAATQAAATKAEAAADALLAWLQAQPRAIGPRPEATSRASEKGEARAEAFSDTPGTEAVEPRPRIAMAVRQEPPDLSDAAIPVQPHDPTPRGRHTPLRLDHTDWLHHRLLIAVPEADLASLRAAAVGAGTVPWHIDFDRMEEDLFHLLVAPPTRAGALTSPARSVSLAGAQILAGQLRAAASRRHALAVARVGHSEACPFDLHALVPVPDTILLRGPDDPEALDWLWTQWGTTQTLRHVAEDEATAAVVAAREPTAPGEAIWALTFWSADWTPWRALAEIAARWPALRFDTRPTYDMP
jgi:hypothetical protein